MIGRRMPPIGDTLREARMRRQLSVADVEERTKIRAKYLRALENEEWGALPGPTFVKTFLRTYAEVVGVDPHLLVEEYRTVHDTGEELETNPRANRPAVSRRPRRTRAPGPPSKVAVAVGVGLALVGFLLVLGVTGGDDESPPSDSAGTDVGRTTTQRERPPRRTTPVRPAAPPPPRGVTLRIAPVAPTYACLDSGQGTAVVFEGTLEGPRTFKNAKRLRVNLGKRDVDMKLNGKSVPVPPSPEPVGYDLTPKGATEIPVGTRPCA